jgi:NAD+ diphosphatase
MSLSAVTNVFSGNPLNRASDRRTDPAYLAQLLEAPQTLALPLWNGQPLVEKTADGFRLAYVSGDMGRELAAGTERLLFLGLWKETAVFAIDMEGSADPAAGPLNGFGEFKDMRAMGAALTGPEAAIAATAKGVFEWRRRHKFCAVCGQPSEAVDGGWKRQCTACKAEHFPRTDPVVIMLPVVGEKCLMGRQAIWPKGMWSALAGFLEPGETIEEACARELNEEAGLIATKVHYHSNQPWPFPNSLMIGLIAEIEDGEAHPDQTELEAVRWFTREEAGQLLRGEIAGAFCPPPLAIAHQLLKSWAEGWSKD